MAYGSSAHALSWDFSPLPLRVPRHTVLPPNTRLAFWNYASSTIWARLKDSLGRSVPGKIVTIPQPTAGFLEMPNYSYFQPYETPVPGKYELQLQGYYNREAGNPKYVIGGALDTTPPPPPSSLTVSLENLAVQIGIDTNVRPIVAVFETKPFLVLHFDPSEEAARQPNSTFYSICARTTPAPGRDSRLIFRTEGIRLRQSGGDRLTSVQMYDGRTILVPLSWFGSGRADESVNIELRAMDRAGNESTPEVKTLVPAATPGVTELWRTLPRDYWLRRLNSLPLEEVWYRDVNRYKAAAANEGARQVFEMLTPTGPIPEGTRADETFREAVLASNRELPLRAAIRGAKGRSTIFLWIRIQNGKASPILSLEDVRVLLGIVPVEKKEVNAVDVNLQSDKRANVRLTLDDGSDYIFNYSVSEPQNVRHKINRILEIREMVRKITSVSRVSRDMGLYEPMDIALDDDDESQGFVDMAFGKNDRDCKCRLEFKGDNLKRYSLEGPADVWTQGEFKQRLREVQQRLKLSKPEWKGAHISGSVYFDLEEYSFEVRRADGPETYFGGKLDPQTHGFGPLR